MNGETPATAGTAALAPTTTPVVGVLEVLPDGNAFLRSASRNYLAHPLDPFVSQNIIRQWRLKEGMEIAGTARLGGDRKARFGLMSVETINNLTPDDFNARKPYADLVSIDPTSRIRLECGHESLSMRVLDLVTPIGKGQRCLIVAPPKAGKTVLLQQIAHSVTTNHPEIHLIVLLIDERPEEVTDMRRNVNGEVIASSMDELTSNHVSVAEIVLERAKRYVEAGRDVIVLLDSITRLSRAYNTEMRGSGKILSGGIDSRTMEKPRRFFGAARNIENGGSLTIIATALVDTGSRMDEVIFQEFKGTGNTEIILDRQLFERRIFPCVDISKSGTRKEEKIYDPAELPKVRALRRALAGLGPVEAMQLLLSRLEKYPTNSAFLTSLQGV
jgi:transcription termination factor Rho